MKGYFKVTDVEPGDELDADITSARSSDHDSMLLAAAKAVQYTDPHRKYVVIDRDLNEVRIGNDVEGTNSGLGNGVERHYFHNFKRVLKTGSNNSAVKLELKNGQTRYFSTPLHGFPKNLYQQLLKGISNSEEYSNGMEGDNDKPEVTTASSISLLDFLVLATLFAVMVFHLYFSPFTKVEESFNVQATHDLLTFPQGLFNRSVIRQHYDHVEFPGVVPRTFWGAFILSTLYGTAHLAVVAGRISLFLGLDDRLSELIALRLLMGVIFLLLCTVQLHKATRQAFPRPRVATLFLVLSLAQFHIPFYSTRLLPNVFATICTGAGQSCILVGQWRSGLAWLIVSSIVFRCDVVVLLLPTAIGVYVAENSQAFMTRDFRTILKGTLDLFFFGLKWAALSLASTVVLDSHMWDKNSPYWPEGVVLFFNTYLNKSSLWGTQPFHWYFSSALPRSLMAAYPFALFGVILGSRTKNTALVFIPSTIFVVLYSFLPHKEVRFMFPIIPAMTLAAACGVDALFKAAERTSGKAIKYGLKIGMLGLVLVSFASSILFSKVSSMNYPGGEALRWLHTHEPSGRVHIDAYTAMSGVSRFTYSPRFVYSKQEREVPYVEFDFILTHHPERSDVQSLFDIAHIQKGDPHLVLPPLITSAMFDANALSKLSQDSFVRLENSVFVMKRKPKHGVSE